MRTAVFKSIKYGAGTDLVWGTSEFEGDFAVREGKTVKIFRNNEQVFQFQKDDPPIKLYGGSVLSVVTENSFSFYHWSNFNLISTLPHSPKKIYWSDTSHLLCLVLS